MEARQAERTREEEAKGREGGTLEEGKTGEERGAGGYFLFNSSYLFVIGNS